MASKRDVVCFCAGPISGGDLDANIRQACEAARVLMTAGLTVWVPHLSAFMGMERRASFTVDGVTQNAYAPSVLAGMPYEVWIEQSLSLVARSDVLLRLPGHSPGADREVEQAMLLAIPVFKTAAEVIEWAEEAVNGLPDAK